MEIEKLLTFAVSQNASDLHLLPNLPPILRVHGDLFPVKDYPNLSSQEVKNLIYSVMTPDQQSAFEKALEFDMAISFPHIGNFRVNVLHQIHGAAGVFRLIPEEVPSFDDLALPSILKSLVVLPHGLILVTGPTGSGKSTTLAAMVEFINCHRASHIITIEDPIEFIFSSKKSIINQRQVGRDTPDIATALRSSLRQDPDVIMLGEMRDLETVRLALTAAETGHLVMVTLHASSAPLAISRIVDIFPAAEKARVRNLVSETLQAVLCQTLVKKIAGGRVAAFEIMLATPAIRHLIRQDMIAHMESTIQTSGDIGMCTLEQYLHGLASRRIITTAIARSTSLHHDRFQL